MNDDNTELPNFGRKVQDGAISEADTPMRQIKTVFNSKNKNTEYSPKEIKTTKQPSAHESKSKSVVIDRVA